MGERLKQVRWSNQFTVSELSRRSGVSRTEIWMIETGKKTNPTMATMKKLADALGQTIGDIFFAESV